jgi:hypothetical protein
VYRLGGIFDSVGHRVKINKITPATGKERGDLEIKDYVVLQRPQEQDDRLPAPRGALREVARKKILHYRQWNINRPDPIAFLPAYRLLILQVDYTMILVVYYFCTLTVKLRL